jgi:hypothetical protein
VIGTSLHQHRRDLRRVWTARWCIPHESCFSRLQKFAWANLANAPHICQSVFGKWAGSRSPDDLLWGEWVDRHRLAGPRALVTKLGFLSGYGVSWPKHLATATSLRYCEACLRGGFHSNFFQILGITHCPRHGSPLRSDCPRCGSSTAPLHLNQELFTTPFRCYRCEAAFAPPLNTGQWVADAERVIEINRALQPVAQWLRLLNKHPNSYRHLPTLQFSPEGQTLTDTDELLVCFDIARELVPLNLDANLLAQPITKLHIRWVMTRPDPSASEDESHGNFTRHSIYKAIRKHLQRTHLRAHRACVHEAACSIQELRTQGEDQLEQAYDVCPVAAAYRRWHLHYLYHRNELRAALGLRAESALMLEAEPLDKNHVLFAESVLADFYACATTVYAEEMWRRAGAVHRHKSYDALFLFRLKYPPEALWSFATEVHDSAAVRHLVVSGNARTLEVLHDINTTRCLSPSKARRAQLKRRAFSAASPASPSTACALPRSVREVWSEALVRPYESALSVLLKYTRLNKPESTHWRALTFRNNTFEGNLLTGHGMRSPAPRIACGEALVWGTLRAYGPRWRCGLNFVSAVRLCVECRAAGYHSIFFQLLPLKLCPLHERLLQVRCADCSAPTPSYRPPHGSLEKFLCKTCGQPILGLAPPGGAADPRISAQFIKSKLSPLAEWIRQCERSHVPDTALPSRPQVPGLTVHTPRPKGWSKCEQLWDEDEMFGQVLRTERAS